MIEQIPGSAGRRGLRQRLFAWMHAQGDSDEYEATIAPYKRRLLSNLSGTVLEIGAGTGENFAYYPPGIHWIGIEPNLFMHEQLLKAAQQHGIDGELRTGVAEKLDVSDSSIDAVVSTMVMCSVSDQKRVLDEIVRVLRPGGRYLFIEHVAAPEQTRLRRIQKLTKPLWRAVADGCEPDRDTAAAVERAGFSRVEIQWFDAPIAIASPHIAGEAIK